MSIIGSMGGGGYGSINGMPAPYDPLAGLDPRARAMAGASSGGGYGFAGFSGGGYGIGSMGLPSQQQLYNNILSGYQGLQGQVLGDISGVQAAGQQSISNALQKAGSSAFQGAISSGLGNSTGTASQLQEQAGTLATQGNQQLASTLAPMYMQGRLATGAPPLQMQQDILMDRLRSSGFGGGGYGAGSAPQQSAQRAAPMAPPAAPQIGPRSNLDSNTNPAASGTSGWTDWGGTGSGSNGSGGWFDTSPYSLGPWDMSAYSQSQPKPEDTGPFANMYGEDEGGD